jgi:hypothetical protein
VEELGEPGQRHVGDTGEDIGGSTPLSLAVLIRVYMKAVLSTARKGWRYAGAGHGGASCCDPCVSSS